MNPTPAARARLIEDSDLVFPHVPVRWWLVLLTVSTTVVLALAAWRILRRRRVRVRPAEPPHTVALRVLAALLRQAGELTAHAYALQISGVLRVYIEARFGLRAPHCSTEEFLHEAERSTQLSPAHRSLVGEFLRGCDRVKFALADLSDEHKLALHASALQFIEGTATQPEKPGALPRKVPAARTATPAATA